MPQAPIFIAEASSNHRARSGPRAGLRRCRSRCGLRRSEVPAVQDRSHVRAGNSCAKRQTSRPPRMGIAECALRPAGRTLFETRNPILLHAVLSRSGGRASSVRRFLQGRVLRASGERSPQKPQASTHRQAGGTLDRHGDDGGDRRRRAHASKPPVHQGRDASALFVGLSSTPAKPRPIFSAIASIREATGCAVGWSDHTRRSGRDRTCRPSLGCACAVEFHPRSLRRRRRGIAPPGIAGFRRRLRRVIARIRESLVADGTGFGRAPTVRTCRSQGMARRSVRRHASVARRARGSGNRRHVRHARASAHQSPSSRLAWARPVCRARC